jgi:regulator of protease activity HflC (stomatin/prohibitin superfamily)
MSLFPTYTTVPARECGVEYVDGAFSRVLGPGRHVQPKRASYLRVSALERLVTTAPQDVLTSDGVSVRVTAVVRSKVVDARRYVESLAEPDAAVYLAVQVALRDALLDVPAETVVRDARRAELLTEALQQAAASVGVEALSVVVKDVVLPPELRSAYAELVTARARGQAQLEAARAETAALRSLANGAKLLEEHPALARQRLVQALPYSSTVELRFEG